MYYSLKSITKYEAHGNRPICSKVEVETCTQTTLWSHKPTLLPLTKERMLGTLNESSKYEVPAMQTAYPRYFNYLRCEQFLRRAVSERLQSLFFPRSKRRSSATDSQANCTPVTNRMINKNGRTSWVHNGNSTSWLTPAVYFHCHVPMTFMMHKTPLAVSCCTSI
jgi:hypothetical protein